MNRNTLKTLSLVVGILLVSLAAFTLINNVILFVDLTKIDWGSNSKYVAYIIITTIISVIDLVLEAIVGYLIIKSYMYKSNEDKYMEYPVLLYFVFGLIKLIIYMFFFGVNSGSFWVDFIFTVAGFVLLVINRFSTLEKKIKNILVLVAIGLAFTLVFNDLINSVGFSIAINLVAVALYVIIFLYFLFKMLLNNNINEEEPENPIQ
ncbi:MAG: hypothetical protein IKP12_01790 [Acholeplasmatales bacterium]|nr:hypothetical protein [Acholeplasmatales bacterium]